MSKIITIIKYAVSTMIIVLAAPVFADANTLSKATTINDAEPFALANIMQMLAGLAFVVVLILLLGWFYRRFGAPSTNSNADLRIVAGISVGQRERVVMLQVGNRQILLGVAAGHVEKLHIFDELVIDTAVPARSDNFAERLATAIKQRGQR